MSSTNPFSGIITDDLKQLWVDAIGALVESCGASTPVILEYGYSLNSPCPNCIYDPIARTSTNRYKTGGPVPFADGKVCPYCSGRGLLETAQTATVFACAIWNHREWMPMGASNNIRNPLSFVQTISPIVDRVSIQSAKSAILDSKRYERYGDCEPVGLGNPSFVLTLWRYMDGA